MTVQHERYVNKRTKATRAHTGPCAGTHWGSSCFDSTCLEPRGHRKLLWTPFVELLPALFRGKDPTVPMCVARCLIEHRLCESH